MWVNMGRTLTGIKMGIEHNVNLSLEWIEVHTLSRSEPSGTKHCNTTSAWVDSAQFLQNTRKPSLEVASTTFAHRTRQTTNKLCVVCTFGAALWRFRIYAYTLPHDVHPQPKKGTFFHCVTLNFDYMTLTFVFVAVWRFGVMVTCWS